MKSITEAYLATSVSRYNIHGKKLLETNDKFYFGDVGDDIEKNGKSRLPTDGASGLRGEGRAAI